MRDRIQVRDVMPQLIELLHLPDEAYQKVVITIEVGSPVMIQSTTIATRKEGER